MGRKLWPVDLLAATWGGLALTACPGQMTLWAEVVKFGVPGTDMPGHELRNDGEVFALADWVLEIRGKNGN